MYWAALAGPREGADSYIHMEQTIESVTLYRFYIPVGFLAFIMSHHHLTRIIPFRTGYFDGQVT